jgi:hypothetical protein
MKHLVTFLLVAFAVFFWSVDGTAVAGHSGCQCKPCKRPGTEAENKSPDITELDVDTTELTSGAPPREMAVSVKTTAEDPEGDVLTYSYTVSGGRIVGTGAKVYWDLSPVRPGTYTITAGADDGCGICGKTITKTVTVTDGN